MSRVVGTKKDIIIVDLDGTLANDNHRSHLIKHDNPNRNQNWDAYFSLCMSDEPIHDIVRLVRILAYAFEIRIFSGRNDIVQEETKQWLTKHMVPYEVLRMRPKECRKQDNELKIEWAQEISERVFFVLEDRARVVKAWRDAGFTCLQVAPGDF